MTTFPLTESFRPYRSSSVRLDASLRDGSIFGSILLLFDQGNDVRNLCVIYVCYKGGLMPKVQQWYNVADLYKQN